MKMYAALFFAIVIMPVVIIILSFNTAFNMKDPGLILIERFNYGQQPLSDRSGIHDPKVVLVKSYRKWARIRSYLKPVHTPINIDFNKDMVIIAALGSKSSGGYSILIYDAKIISGNLEIYIQSSSPGLGCGRTMTVTQPVDAVKIKRVSSPVRFIQTQKVISCL